jgi:hypothetical protein
MSEQTMIISNSPVVPSAPTNKWSIDRQKIVKENIPDCVAEIVVSEVLSLVGDSDWNDPLNVSRTIARMMSVENVLDSTVSKLPHAVAANIDRTMLVNSKDDARVPFWICQSVIRLDEKKYRYIDHEGSKYNKLDIILESEYFKKRMDQVAKAAKCTWNVRWGNSKNKEQRLYRKTRTGSNSDEPWLDRCAKHLITADDMENNSGINIKNLLMVEFKKVQYSEN